MDTSVIRVALIDDHQVFAEAVAGRLSQESDMHVVGFTKTPDQSLDLLSVADVDVVILDLDLGGYDGLALGRDILNIQPDVAIVVVTGKSEDATAVLEAVQMGVLGWVDKRSSIETLLSAVRSATKGESQIPADLLSKALRYLSSGARAISPEAAVVSLLTPREMDVLFGLMNGLSRQQISERLLVSPNTTRTHVQSILAKFHVHSALGAVALARRAGLQAKEVSG